MRLEAKGFILQIRQFLNINNSLFVLIKYIEFGILAFIYFRLAKIVGPIEYGKTTLAFLIISYSGFALLGLMPYIVKKFASFKNSDVIEEQRLIYYQLMYVFVVSFLIFFFINVVFSFQYNFIVSLICISKILQDVLLTVHRVRNRVLVMNLISISFSVPFFVLFLIFPVSLYTYFWFWAIGLWISIGIAVLTLFDDIFNPLLSFLEFKRWVKMNFFSIFKESLSFGVVGILGVLVSSLDRLILIRFVTKEHLGNYQLADNVATVATLGIGAISYLGSYNILSRLSTGKMSPIVFLVRGYLGATVLGLVLLMLLIPTAKFAGYYFEEYSFLSWLLPPIFANRFLDLMFTIPCLIWISKSQQNIYSGFLFALILSITVVLLLSPTVIHNEKTLLYSFPIIVLILKAIFLLIMYIKIYSSETSINIY